MHVLSKLSYTPAIGLALLLALLAAMPVHAQYKPATTVVRDIQTFHVNKDGSSTQWSENTVRIDTPQGVQSGGEQRVSYVSTLEDLEILEAYTLQPDGTRINVAPDRIRTVEESYTAGAPIFSDSKIKVIVFPKVDVGSQLHSKFKSVQHTPYFAGHFFTKRYYSPHVRYEDVVVNLTHDSGISLLLDARGMQGGQVERLATDPEGVVRYRYTFSQLKAYPYESGRVALSDFAPHFAVSSFVDYAALGRAYQATAHPQTAVTPQIRKLAEELVVGAVDTRDKVRRLYNWVSSNIRYVGIYMGAGGFIPHDAQSILDNRYGDCKDHVVILESLLNAVGIDSSPALINLGNAFLLPKVTTSGPFNHAITYVPALNLYLDSTAMFAPMGVLPLSVMGKPTVLTATGQIHQTPLTNIARDFTHTDIRMAVMPDGKVKGSSTYRMSGHAEVGSRSAQFDYINQDPVQVINDLLGRFSETGTGEIKASRPLDLSEPWQVQAVFELDPQVNLPGPSAMMIPVGLAPGFLKGFSSYKSPQERRYPARCSSGKHTENIEMSFPRNVRIERIPPSLSFKRGDIEYTSHYALNGRVLRIKREMTSRRNGTLCPADDDEVWAAFVAVLQRDLRAQVFMR